MVQGADKKKIFAKEWIQAQIPKEKKETAAYKQTLLRMLMMARDACVFQRQCRKMI